MVDAAARLRLIFCGTPEFAVPSLQRLLHDPEFEVAAIITQPDRPRGRGGEISCSPIKQVAQQARIPVFQPVKIRSDESFGYIRDLAPDVIVIIAYGQIIPAKLLDVPHLGWINLHGSLLPKYRGAAPIQWAIARGETHTGLTTMRIDAGMDTGPTLLRWETEIGPDETAPELSARMAAAGAELMAETLRRYARDEIAPQPQDHSQATLAPMLKREDGRIDWTRPSQEIYNRMRGFAPWPGAYTTFRGQTCHVWGRPARLTTDATGVATGSLQVIARELLVRCGDNSWLRVEAVQVEGRKRITGREFASGTRLQSGERFT